MSPTVLLIFPMMMLRSANAQFGGGGGGPSTFGYDASSTCSKPYSRNSRARFEKLPCDFRRQNWCTVAGSAYPWHAVRRFVQENKGLMRRMYGDERHINILKAELEKNDIELEYEDRYQRYPDESRRFQYEDEYEFLNFEDQQRSKSRDDGSSYKARSFTGDSFDESTTERTRKFESVEFTRPNTRTSRPTTVPNSSTSSSSSDSSIDEKKPSSNLDATTTIENLSMRSSTSSISTLESSTEKISTENWTEKILPEVGNDNSSRTEKVPSTIPAVTLSDIARIKNSSINEIPGQSERLKDHVAFDATDLPIVQSSMMIEETTLESGVTSETASSPATIDRIGEAELDEDFQESSIVADQIFAASEQQPQQQFRPRPEYRPTESKPETSNLEGQLFQDVAAKDQQEQPVLKLRGINACPVKEEVVAPFWANNTRGEVLALLNLYPFEQYVHWEKCTHENKQMYCRDGCRCEQQYRLHRLLAYDPNNECRGIFSDWFKFPSCCVCRCYDLPVEFRVTSRSPRIQKQKLKLRPPGQG